VSQAFVKIAIRKAGYDLKDFSFEGAQATAVLTQSQEFSIAGLLPEMKAFIVKGLAEAPGNVEVKLAGGDKKILLPGGKVEAHFRPPFSGKYEGNLFLTAELEVDGRLVKVLPVRANVEVYHPVVVTSRRVDKGDKFTEDNVTLIRKPTSALLSGSIGQLENVLGRTAAMMIAAGSVLRLNELYDPPVIKHGQVVEAVVRRGNVEITVQVRAIEDGKAGDPIRVENTTSHKVLQGKVLDEKKVVIEEGAGK
jgi:flagella basal body P-ring formation protein FlgA